MPTPSAPPPQPHHGPPREPDVVVNRTADAELMRGRVNTDFVIEHDQRQQARARQQAVETANAVQDAADEATQDSRRRDEQTEELESATIERNRPKIADNVDPDTHERITSKQRAKSKERSRQRRRER